ncbi:hypothetical protein MLD52_03635 [Puniceicoccaceae bacterium K14]|nr:hypothetical protein [Puniceicoccaceae bacterium K14]
MHLSFCCAVLSFAVAFATLRGEEDIFEFDFSEGLGLFVPLNPENWVTEDGGVSGIASLKTPGKHRPPVRRPREYAILEDKVWKDYEFIIRAQSREDISKTGRDITLIFGYQDDLHFYYVHICAESNGRFHNVIMKVAGEERFMIQEPALPEVRLREGWNDIKLTHLSTGAISIYVGDMDTPFMVACDTAYEGGVIGFGCFDDRGWFDDIVVTGKLVEE